MAKCRLHLVYTDGSCLKNPGGASGWSFCVLCDNVTWLVSGGEHSSTNNRMELVAVIEALKWHEGLRVKLCTDSLLTMKCALGLWKRKSNMDLWEEYDHVSRGRDIKWSWVKAHSGNKYNEMVDHAARAEAKLQKNKNLVSK